MQTAFRHPAYWTVLTCTQLVAGLLLGAFTGQGMLLALP